MTFTHTITNKILSDCKNNLDKYDSLFQKNKELGERFYTQLKSDSESKVVSWTWATGQMFSPEPFYFQEHRYKQGEWLDNQPDDIEDFYCYGLDLNNRIIIERRGFNYFGNKDREPVYYETFYHYNLLNQVIQSFYFSYDTKTHPTNHYFFEYENDKLIYVYRMFNQSKNNKLAHYAVENDLYIAKYELNISTKSLINSNHIIYLYGENKQLDKIERVYENMTQLIYKTPTNEIDINAVKAWLINHIQTLIEKNKPRDKIYSFFLYYGSEDILPPYLYYGYQFYRDEMSRMDEFNFCYVWHPAEFPEEFELPYLSDVSIPENVFLFLQESQHEDQEKLLCEVAIEIKTWLTQNYESLLTDDFSVVLTHFELHTFNPFFKLINPERYETLKYQFENF
ncbi:hypothetical protein [Thorsellia anophelis]|uniref:Uncharacterized protein n=1 Tax=Thorsellia anophelis DSM 18579 TaxID=1123402 RepID=A0A1I0CA29_9GAMM|nr:hypothetical protein [Thorsellia anophelis]SET16237.1 hypothetical protein SAMN02583745_01538 [Thorsellia anophelis DSM 18579]